MPITLTNAQFTATSSLRARDCRVFLMGTKGVYSHSCTVRISALSGDTQTTTIRVRLLSEEGSTPYTTHLYLNPKPLGTTECLQPERTALFRAQRCGFPLQIQRWVSYASSTLSREST
jgi:hypothetical protein